MFRNRAEAGKKLAQALQDYARTPETLVVALPRGGVEVGYEVAQALQLPLDIVVPRKIGALQNPEYAIGAITETGQAILNPSEITGIDPDWLKRKIHAQQQEAQRRLNIYRQNSPSVLHGKTVMVVDDGIATGYTMRAAVAMVKARGARKIVVAVPHSSAEALTVLRREVAEVVVLEVPEPYFAVGAHYQEFPQTSDQEVVDLLAHNK